ncbi:cation-translocating P-type ATPase [Cyclobacterium plantarum]|uniref:HAD-IC family P-type ATPase n=1 Tax=Cyclobacterium plantarum TaxID=2716263 RepID=A0ABX0HHL9_9BACT|nr:HAD-IC family P-type ATPase [Cyclobacterium plantarum]NHE59876.1 HAD-IC family P-type ATPase [Cyclobacterium plantarum]
MIQIPDHPHSIHHVEIKKALETSESGISQASAEQRKRQFGLNEIPDRSKKSLWSILFKQFQNIMVYILLVAAFISFLTGHQVDVIVILVIVGINIAIGFIQEYKAENAMQSLKGFMVPQCKVIREGKLSTIPSKELVPGDLMSLSAGDLIPADGVIFQTHDAQAMEASLTGEAVPVEKDANPGPEASLVADRKNMVWKGTFLTSGETLAWVTATGLKTQLGLIADSIYTIPPKDSNFKKKSDMLAKQMAILAIISSLILFFAGYFFQEIPVNELLLISIAALVSAIPEGLPAVLSIVLAIGSYRMSKKNAIIREISATESLGTVSTIVTDKTGTLTQNTMTINTLWQIGGAEVSVSGEGWEHKGEITGSLEDIAAMDQLLEIAAHCNNATVSLSDTGKYQISGDPTEAAFAVLAKKAGVEKKLPILEDFPFSSKLKYRSSIIEKPGGLFKLFIGAPEIILLKSTRFMGKESYHPLDANELALSHKKLDDWSKKSYRVLGLAFKPLNENRAEEEEEEGEMIFCGLAAMIDPPRPEVPEAVKACHEAGIRVIMATGDHAQTALAIGKEVGIVLPGREQVLSEADLLQLKGKDFDKAIQEVDIFSRLSPLMKLRIAKSLQDQGELVAMTGDGVNDAPALKQANVGVSMGIMGTDVAREASLVVLADDNFATIVKAVEQGRIVFNNARRTSFFLVTTNLAEILTLIVAIGAGYPLPLTATQILWINLVTDGFCDKALATEAGVGNELKKPPVNPKENIINKEVLPSLILNTIFMTGLALIGFMVYLPQGLDKARTIVFIILAFTQLFNVFNMRNLKGSAFKVGLFSNKWVNYALLISISIQVLIIEVPYFAGLFEFQSISFLELLSWVFLSSFVLWINELYKLIFIKNEI